MQAPPWMPALDLHSSGERSAHTAGCRVQCQGHRLAVSLSGHATAASWTPVQGSRGLGQKAYNPTIITTHQVNDDVLLDSDDVCTSRCECTCLPDDGWKPDNNCLSSVGVNHTPDCCSTFVYLLLFHRNMTGKICLLEKSVSSVLPENMH